MQYDFGAWKGPIVYGRTFDFVKSFSVKADRAIGYASLHFDIYVSAK